MHFFSESACSQKSAATTSTNLYYRLRFNIQHILVRPVINMAQFSDCMIKSILCLHVINIAILIDLL